MAETFTKDSVRAQVLELLGKHTQPGAKVALDSHITGDLGLDSLAIMEVVADVEDHFGLTFPDDALPGIRTVRDVLVALERRLDAEGKLA
jgi:acyl carrier protein